MKRILFLLVLCPLFLCLLSVRVPAQLLERPLSFTRPDSVQLEDMFWTHAYEEVWQYDSLLRARPVVLTAKDRKHYATMERQWQTCMNGTFALWGGSRAHSLYDLPHQVPTALRMALLSARLFLLTGKACYAETLERALYNGVRAGTSPTLSRKVRRQSAEALLGVTGLMYASRGTDVYVNLYVRSQAYVKTDSLDMLVLQSTSAPWQMSTFFSFRFDRDEQHMRLHLRLPGWLRGSVMAEGGAYRYLPQREYYQLSINGKPSLMKVEDGYIVVDRTWRTNDVLVLKMDTPVRRIVAAAPAAGQDNGVALQFGPLLYVSETPLRDRLLVPTEPIGFRFDLDARNVELLEGRLHDARLPLRAGEKGSIPFVAVPYFLAAKEGADTCRLWFPAGEK